MKIKGMTLYNLFRYAHKNCLFDEEEEIKEIHSIFSELRKQQGNMDNMEYEIKLTKYGKY
jgi:hypothetical protein